MLRIKAQKR